MRRILSTAIALGLVTAGAIALPARAGKTAVPKKVQIEDPVGDANYLNDQGFGGTGIDPAAVPDTDDNETAADIGNASDIMRVWFSNTKETITAHIQTELPPPGTQGLAYRIHTNAGEGKVGSNDTGCLWFEAYIAGVQAATGVKTTYQGESFARVRDMCDDFADGEAAAEAELGIEELEDGTGLTTITVKRNVSAKFANGQKIVAPYVEVRNLSGPGFSECVPGVACTYSGVTAPVIDTTKRGLDFAIKSSKTKKPKPKPKPNPKPKPKPNPNKCATYVPGEAGKDAPSVVVTDAATEAKPVEVKLEASAGLGMGSPGFGIPTDALIGHAYQNIQVDSKAKEAGLWVRLETPENSDYDLYLMNPDGSSAAYAAGFNPHPETVGPFSLDGTGHGGHSEPTAEQIDGVKTADCQGYTADVATATGQGGELTMKLWLGEIKYDPASAGGAESASARSFF